MRLPHVSYFMNMVERISQACKITPTKNGSCVLENVAHAQYEYDGITVNLSCVPSNDPTSVKVNWRISIVYKEFSYDFHMNSSVDEDIIEIVRNVLIIKRIEYQL
jgi:hypothetical protein